MRTFARTALLAVALASPAAARADIILYDGSLNTTPTEQGWLYASQPPVGSSASYSASGGFTTLDTSTVITDRAGFATRVPGFGAHPLMPTLDRNTGYTLQFTAAVDAESHVSPDRAGFSVIVLSEDQQGIELGFWTDRVFAQSSTFQHAEQALVDTTVATQYELKVLGSSYDLSAGGVSILTGSLRDYSAAGAPYTIGSFVFLGDDTSSAKAVARIGGVAFVPEPASILSMLFGLGFLGAAKARLGRYPALRKRSNQV